MALDINIHDAIVSVKRGGTTRWVSIEAGDAKIAAFLTRADCARLADELKRLAEPLTEATEAK